MRYLRFFFGTPRRLLASTAALVFLFVVEKVAPGFLATGLTAVGISVLTVAYNLFAPLAWAVLPFIIVGIGFRIMMRGLGGKKRK